MAKSATPSKQRNLKPPTLRWDVFIIDLASRFGVGGACVLALLTMFLLVGSKEQHQEFIDKFFLWKFPKDDNYILYFVLLCLVVLFFGQTFYFRLRIKLKNERIKELEADKKLLQDKLLQ